MQWRNKLHLILIGNERDGSLRSHRAGNRTRGRLMIFIPTDYRQGLLACGFLLPARSYVLRSNFNVCIFHWYFRRQIWSLRSMSSEVSCTSVPSSAWEEGACSTRCAWWFGTMQVLHFYFFPFFNPSKMHLLSVSYPLCL